MKFQDIKVGEIFTIGETPSYPKLRTKTGYVDMRDDIVKTCDTLSWDIRIMDIEEIAQQFETDKNEINKWIAQLIERYITECQSL